MEFVQRRRCDYFVLSAMVSVASLYLVANLPRMSTSATRSIPPRVVFSLLAVVLRAATDRRAVAFATLAFRRSLRVGKEP